MKVGCLGDVVFEVSERSIETIQKLTMSGTATYATHQRHMRYALTEFVGLPPETITMDIKLSLRLGVDPWNEFKKLRKYMVDRKTLALVIGTKTFGRYRWTITSYKTEMELYTADIKLENATISLTLQEYLKS